MLERLIVYLVTALAVAGCVTQDRIGFQPASGQSNLIRDGKPAISSVKANSAVMLARPRSDVPQGERVGFVLAFQNRSNEPVDFRVSDVEVIQKFPDRPEQPIKVLTFDQLQSEERARQVARAVVVGLAAGANAAAASQAGYYQSRSTIYTPRGTYVATTTGYSPAAAAIAASNAAAQNAHMMGNALAEGQANLARLENEYIKDHTALPGEWYGGTLGIEPPIFNSPEETKNYVLRLRVGAEVHSFEISQTPIKN